jgi:hypothetical protein
MPHPEDCASSKPDRDKPAQAVSLLAALTVGGVALLASFLSAVAGFGGAEGRQFVGAAALGG